MTSFNDCFNNFVQSGGHIAQNVPHEDSGQSSFYRQMLSCTPTPSESSSTISVPSESSMEHSYLQDTSRTDTNNGLAPARTILVRHAPQCPTCHTLSAHEESGDGQQVAHIPPYDEIASKELMNECARIANYVRNPNFDDLDWQERINRVGWMPSQEVLFDKVVSILDHDQLARLANEKRQHEAVHRRITVDKSSSRMRRALASVAWEPRLTQWIHALLMEFLPPSYMASYLDIMQTLKTKLPTLTDKMLFSRPFNSNQELLAPVMKKRWQPEILSKSRHLPHNAIIVALPSMPTHGQISTRMQNWYQALSTITQVVQISLPNSSDRIGRQNLDQVAETIVSFTRVRIQELRSENPNRGIILVGFNAGSALALQVAMSESLACIICMGFAYNTLRGPRGAPDDRLLDLKLPILFVVGQNSARSSQEEMEGLRERLQSESSLVIVGSADDALRVPKSKRRIEGVTQGMVDSMIVDEVYEFINKTLSNPPGPRVPTSIVGTSSYQRNPRHVLTDANIKAQTPQPRKRKAEGVQDEGGVQASKSKYVPHIRSPRVSKPYARLVDPFAVKRKVGRPRTRPLPTVVPATPKQAVTPTEKHMLGNEELNLSMESILDDSLEYDAGQQSVSGAAGAVSKPVAVTPTVVAKTSNTVSLAAGTKIKVLPPTQFVQMKAVPAQATKLVNYSIGKSSGSGSTTVGTTAPIGTIVKTLPSTGGQQIFTLKTQSGQTTQFVTAASGTTQSKFTVVKTSNGTLQVPKTSQTVSVSNNTNMDLTNIINMPIVFADSEGNIGDQQQKQPADQSPKVATASSAPMIISQKIIKEAVHPFKSSSGILTSSSVKTPNIVINKGIQQLFNTPNSPINKLVYVNRNAIKPVTTVATSTTGNRVLPPGATPLPIRILSGSSTKPSVTTTNQVVLDAKTLQSIKASGLTTTAGGVVSLGNKTFPQFQVVSSSAVAGDGKQPMRNIVVKSATGMKSIQMLANRSTQGIALTTPGGAAVRHVVNIPNPRPTATVTIATSAAQQHRDGKLIKATATMNPKGGKGGVE